MLFNPPLCTHILLQSGGWTWDTTLYTVRGVGSGSRDVDVWLTNGSVRRGSGAPSTDDPSSMTTLWGLNVVTHCPSPHRT